MEQLSNNLIEIIAQKKGISKAKAAKFIDKCLEKISVEMNTSYNRVYEAFYTFTGLTTCIAGSCDKATIEECSKYCHCVDYKGHCVSRYITTAAQINADPDKWTKGMSTAELEQLVEYASYLYYNYDGGGLTDNSFDALEYQLNKRLKSKGRRWEKIGAEPVDKIRTKLPYPMPSLDKLKPGMSTLLSFLAIAPKHGMVWSNKLDGVSGLIVFNKGAVEGMYTRGNGEIGGDVGYLRDYITLPKPSYRYLVVRGEFILSKRVWQEKYADSMYSNPRSFVSAKIGSGYLAPSLIDIEFVAYQIVDWSEKGLPSPSQGFKILTEQGFQTPDNGLFEQGYELLAFDVISRYKENRENSPYVIDGLVLSVNLPQPIKKLGNPDYSKAFKMTLEEQLRDSKITNVDWNITRHGRYFPVAIFESVYIDGVRIHRASAHNAQHVSDWRMGRGTKIVVTRSGDVIPTIKDVIVNEKINPILPPEDYDWSWSGKDIILDDIEGNPQVHIKRNTHFFTTIHVPGLGPGRVAKLYDSGMTTIKDIVSATEKDFKKIKGFGPKISNQLYTGIHTTMRKTRMDRYFVAITTFKTRIGRTLLKQVIRAYPGIMSASEKEILVHLRKHKIAGIGAKRQQVLAESIPQFRKILMAMNKEDIKFAIKNNEDRVKNLELTGYNEMIKGHTFVLTGFIDHPNYDLEDYLWDHWGNISSVVTSDTTAVIAASLANVSGKMTKAHELGIPVYSLAEFVTSFEVPIRVPEQPEIVIPEYEEI